MCFTGMRAKQNGQQQGINIGQHRTFRPGSMATKEAVNHHKILCSTPTHPNNWQAHIHGSQQLQNHTAYMQVPYKTMPSPKHTVSYIQATWLVLECPKHACQHVDGGGGGVTQPPLSTSMNQSTSATVVLPPPPPTIRAKPSEYRCYRCAMPCSMYRMLSDSFTA